MIATETRTVRHTETGAIAFTFDTPAPSLSVALPDGTAGTAPTVTDTIDPLNALRHILSANVAFPQGGPYELRWSMKKGGEDPILRIETYFATWTDVYSLIRSGLLLNRSMAQLPDADIDLALTNLSMLLTTDYPCLGAYNDLIGNDRAYFDRAMAYMVAASLRGGLGRLPTDGDLLKRREGDTEYTFADRGKGVTESQEALWLTDAWSAFSRIGCIAAGLPDVRSALRWSLNGRRRAAEKAGYIVGSANPLLRYLIDEDRRLQGIGVY